MAETVSLLMLEFLSWVSTRPRTYDEAMEAWRSTCPRQTIWEDALIEGLIELGSDGSLSTSEVTLTSAGRALLDKKAGSNGRKSPRECG
jgi:hypothetical protein